MTFSYDIITIVRKEGIMTFSSDIITIVRKGRNNDILI